MVLLLFIASSRAGSLSLGRSASSSHPAKALTDLWTQFVFVIPERERQVVELDTVATVLEFFDSPGFSESDGHGYAVADFVFRRMPNHALEATRIRALSCSL